MTFNCKTALFIVKFTTLLPLNRMAHKLPVNLICKNTLCLTSKLTIHLKVSNNQQNFTAKLTCTLVAT